MNDDRHLQALLRAPAPEAAAAARRVADHAALRGHAELVYTTFRAPVGELLLVRSRSGLARLTYIDGELDAALAAVAAQRSPRIVESAAPLAPWRRELEEYFDGVRREFEAPLDWSEIVGFRRRVLRATAAIGYGDATTYKAMAKAAGSPAGARAAGNALGSNPLPIVIPCHRVKHVGGGLGGYTGGLDRKRLLLELEGG